MHFTFCWSEIVLSKNIFSNIGISMEGYINQTFQWLFYFIKKMHSFFSYLHTRLPVIDTLDSHCSNESTLFINHSLPLLHLCHNFAHIFPHSLSILQSLARLSFSMIPQINLEHSRFKLLWKINNADWPSIESLATSASQL